MPAHGVLTPAPSGPGCSTDAQATLGSQILTDTTAKNDAFLTHCVTSSRRKNEEPTAARGGFFFVATNEREEAPSRQHKRAIGRACWVLCVSTNLLYRQ